MTPVAPLTEHRRPSRTYRGGVLVEGVGVLVVWVGRGLVEGAVLDGDGEGRLVLGADGVLADVVLLGADVAGDGLGRADALDTASGVAAGTEPLEGSSVGDGVSGDGVRGDGAVVSAPFAVVGKGVGKSGASALFDGTVLISIIAPTRARLTTAVNAARTIGRGRFHHGVGGRTPAFSRAGTYDIHTPPHALASHHNPMSRRPTRQRPAMPDHVSVPHEGFCPRGTVRPKRTSAITAQGTAGSPVLPSSDRHDAPRAAPPGRYRVTVREIAIIAPALPTAAANDVPASATRRWTPHCPTSATSMVENPAVGHGGFRLADLGHFDGREPVAAHRRAVDYAPESTSAAIRIVPRGRGSDLLTS